MSSSPILRGACACNSTSWTSTAAPIHLDFCYCSQCQRVSGAPFVSWMGINRSSLTWSGPVQTFRLHISNGMNTLATRSCCSSCGGTLTMQYDCYPEKTHVAAGTVVEDVEGIMNTLKAGTHIFLEDKPAWYTIPEDGVERHQAFDQAFLDYLKEWEEKQKHKQSEVSMAEPFDNELHEDDDKVQSDFSKRQEEEEEEDGESDEEIRMLRQRYGGTQIHSRAGVTLDDVDSD